MRELRKKPYFHDTNEKTAEVTAQRDYGEKMDRQTGVFQYYDKWRCQNSYLRV